MFKKFLIGLLGLVALYLLHVPALKFLTYVTAPSAADYPLIYEGASSENFEVSRVFIGNIYDVVYDPQTKHTLIMGEHTDTLTEERYGYYVVTLDENGQVISEKQIRENQREAALANPRFRNVPKMMGKKYPPEYDFGDIAPQVTLAHYQFQTHDEWVKMTMVGPIILSDWEGMAYLDIPHQGEVLHARVPTVFFGGVLYLGSSLDGQIYPCGPTGSGLRFIEVDESSFGMRSDGPDIHREGLGLYVIRPRQAH